MPSKLNQWWLKPILKFSITQKQKRWVKIIGFSLLGIFVVPLLLAFILLWAYQNEIIQYFKKEVRDQYGMNVNIKSSEIAIFSDWPNATIVLHETDIRDTLNLFGDKPFLRAEEVGLSLGLFPLFKKKFSLVSINIRKAKVQIFIDSTGRSNAMFLTKGISQDHSASRNDVTGFRNIILSDSHFILMDEEQHKAIDIQLNSIEADVNDEQGKNLVVLNGKCFVNRLAFDTKEGDFLKGKYLEMENWQGEMSNDLMNIHFSQAKTIIEKHPFDLQLDIQAEGEGLLTLKVNTRKLERRFGLSLLSDTLQRTLAVYKWTGLLDVEADIKTPLKTKHDPSFTLTGKLDNNDFYLDNNPVPLAGIQGMVTVHVPADSIFAGDLTKGTLSATITKATINKWPLTGKVFVEDLITPVLTTNLSLNISASTLNAGIVNGPWSGTANALIKVKLPIDVANADNLMEHIKSCNIVLQSSDIHYKVKNKKSLRLDLLAYLNTEVLEIRKCNVTQGGQSVQLSGVVHDFLGQVLLEKNYWKSNLKLTSEHIALENWLDNIKQITESQPAKKTNSSPTMDMSEMDNIVLDVDVKKLSFEKFTARQIKGQLLMKPQLAEIKNLSLYTCEGIMQADIACKNSRFITGNAKFKNAQVGEIFKNFSNFKQDVVKAEQLEGVMNLDASFSLEIDTTFNVLPNSLAAVVDLSITDGNLKNFEPFEKISKFIFKKRKLDDVAFSDLKQRFSFNGTLMQIDLFEIKSTAFWIFLEGTYNFKGESDLRIQIPWKNFKHIPEDAIYGERAEDGRTAKSLFLKAMGPNGKISISYDLSQGGKRKARAKARRNERRK